jgi:hypothetical protein
MNFLVIMAILTLGSLGVAATSLVTMERSLKRRTSFETRVAGCINRLVYRTEYLTETLEGGLDCLLEDDAQRDPVGMSGVR